jgi:hypothetical protein
MLKLLRIELNVFNLYLCISVGGENVEELKFEIVKYLLLVKFIGHIALHIDPPLYSIDKMEILI